MTRLPMTTKTAGPPPGLPWYKNTKLWIWLAGGTALVSTGGYLLYRYLKKGAPK